MGLAFALSRMEELGSGLAFPVINCCCWLYLKVKGELQKICECAIALLESNLIPKSTMVELPEDAAARLLPLHC